MPARPNIAVIMTDQQRSDLFASEGYALDTMPFLDGFGRGGTRFRRAYTPTPACTPARTSLLTGRFASAHRVRQNSAVKEVVRGPDLLDVLRDAGYSTHFAGKTHVYRGSADDFDTFSGPYWHISAPDKTPEEKEFSDWLAAIDHGPTDEPTPFPLECQYPYRVTSDAIAAVDAAPTDRPNFFWLSIPEPHNPYQAPEPYFSMFAEADIPDRACGPESAVAKGGPYRWLRELLDEKRPGYDEKWRRYAANYCGMLRLIDDQIRRFVDHLEARGLLDNTIVVFLSDHGDFVGEYGLQRKGAGLSEALLRVPFLIRGPGIVESDNTHDFVSLVDLLPTLCEAVGQPIPYGVQGRSLWPMLTGEDYPSAEFDSIYAEGGYGGIPYNADERPPLHFDYAGTKYDELNSVTQSGTTKAVRHDRWKLLYHVTGEGELYDLAADPMELTNLWADPEHAEVRAKLVERLLSWTTRVVDDLPLANYDPKRAPHNWYAPFQSR